MFSVESINKIYSEDLKDQFSFTFSLKKEQLDILSYILNGKDTFGILPTGYGKSMCFILPPLIVPNKISLVISPLRGLMISQVASLSERGIKAACILTKDEMSKEVSDGEG